MALISFGSIITNMKGKVGGSVFSANSSGATMRNKSIPKRSTTDRRSLVNNFWQYITQAWLTIGIVSQGNWETYAANFTFHNKLGVPVAAKGNIVFSITNYYTDLWGVGFVQDPGTYLAAPNASLGAYGMNLTSNIYALFFTPLVADTNFVIYASKPYTFGKRAFMEKRLLKIQINTLLATESDIDFTTNYQTVWGTPPAGSFVLVAWRRINPLSFVWSPLQYIEIEVTA